MKFSSIWRKWFGPTYDEAAPPMAENHTPYKLPIDDPHREWWVIEDDGFFEFDVRPKPPVQEPPSRLAHMSHMEEITMLEKELPFTSRINRDPK